MEVTPPTICGSGDGTLIVSANSDYEYNLNRSGWKNQNQFDHLSIGTYLLEYRLRDSECSIIRDTSFEMTADDSNILIIIDSLRLPTCQEDSNGYLSIRIEGIENPDVSWSHNTELSALVLDNLPMGTYKVGVTGEDGCYQERSFVLSMSEPVDHDVVEEIYEICAGHNLEIEIPNDNQYIWYGPDAFFQIGNEVSLNIEGQYQVQLLNGTGCLYFDTLDLVYLESFFEANFLIPSEVAQGEPFKVIENSWPLPDSVKWIIEDPGLQVISETDYQLELMSERIGNYIIQMQAYSGACYVEIEKWVSVLEFVENQEDTLNFNSEIQVF